MATLNHSGIISAGHQKTAEAGMEMLRLGGNAFDAAVAAILASFVTEPGLTSPAGGGFLLAHTRENQNILFDFFVQSPHQKNIESIPNFYPIHVDFGATVQEFHIGLGSMAVPGNIAGVFAVHEKLGILPFKVVVEPAIQYAKNGIELNEYQTYIFNLLKPIMTASPESRKVYTPQDSRVQAGDRIYMKDLAATLAYLAEAGPREFYEGEIAHQLVQDCQTYGGYLTLKDLKNYRVIERKPLTINYRGNILFTNPPLSSGGTLIAFALELMSQLNLQTIGFGSSEYLEMLAHVMQLTNEARRDGYDAYLYEKNIAQQFLEDSHLELYQKKLKNVANKWGSTTHISVIDNEGNAASVTTSNGEGSSYVIPGTGMMMNNMLGEADLNPLGFHNWPENVRISSMMAPTIVLKNNQPEIVLGSGGSNRIRTAILQVISNIIDFQMDVKTAVESPRTHWENHVFHVEPGLNEEEVKKTRLPDETKLVLWPEKNMFFGGVHTVIQNEEGLISGAGDLRRGGAIACC